MPRMVPIARLLLFFIPLMLLGCDFEPIPGWPPEETEAETPENRMSKFDPQSAGTIRGQVIWHGDIPAVKLFRFHQPIPGQGVISGEFPNPNEPQIDEVSRGVGDVMIFLRGDGLRAQREWDHALVRVELRDFQIRIVQGEVKDSRFGIVRRGDAIEMVSRQPVMHSLRARGAEFFTLKFPDPDDPLEWTFPKTGLVTLSSATNYYWAKAYLFVTDHPYYARTDQEGRFELSQVPPGNYEIVCWAPNWRVARHERDPETGVIARQWYHDPIEQTEQITVTPKGNHAVSFHLSKRMGERAP